MRLINKIVVYQLVIRVASLVLCGKLRTVFNLSVEFVALR